LCTSSLSLSVGLGGGSLVRSSDGKVTIGPDSVGYRITSEARVFGGETLTTTDIAISCGLLDGVGDASRVADVPRELASRTLDRIRIMMERAMDSMKTTNKDIPVYLVGGGAFLIPEDLAGVSQVHRFAHYECANAVGAAIAQIAGEVDVVVELGEGSIKEAQRRIEQMAIDRAVAQGAVPDTVTVVESEAIPVAYTAGRCRLFAKAAGKWNGHGSREKAGDLHSGATGTVSNSVRVTKGVDEVWDAASILAYRPNVRAGVWSLSPVDLEWIATGTYILGCGGGGDPSHCFLAAREMVRAGNAIRVVDLDSLAPSDLCGWGGYLGSPEVSAERLFGNE
jgi:hypothetical protein